MLKFLLIEKLLAKDISFQRKIKKLDNFQVIMIRQIEYLWKNAIIWLHGC